MLLQSFVDALYGTDWDEAVFWSGLTGGVGALSVAEEIALAHGGTTLERLVKRRGITLPPWDINSPVSVNAWTVASLAYAKCASGCMRVVLGAHLRPGNIWEAVEFPALKANPKVAEVVRIDPITGARLVIFSKG